MQGPAKTLFFVVAFVDLSSPVVEEHVIVFVCLHTSVQKMLNYLGKIVCLGKCAINH